MFVIFGCIGYFFAEPGRGRGARGRVGVFSSCSKWGLLSSAECSGFSLQRLHLSQSTGSRARRLQWLWLLGSRPQAAVVMARGLHCLSERGIFLEQGPTLVPCTAKWILNHWTTREAQGWTLSSLRNTDLDPGDPDAQGRVGAFLLSG